MKIGELITVKLLTLQNFRFPFLNPNPAFLLNEFKLAFVFLN